MGKLYDAMAESIFKHKQSGLTPPSKVLCGKTAFDVICFENGLVPGWVRNTYVNGVEVIFHASMEDNKYKVI